MDAIAYLLTFVCLGLVLGWYIANEEAGADGARGWLALKTTRGEASARGASLNALASARRRYVEKPGAAGPGALGSGALDSGAAGRAASTATPAPLAHLAAAKARGAPAGATGGGRLSLVDGAADGSSTGENPFRKAGRRYKTKDAPAERFNASGQGRSLRGGARVHDLQEETDAPPRGAYRRRRTGRYAAKIRFGDLDD